MGYIPIFLDVGGKPCLVVGGGEVALRKVRALLDAAAAVTVLSPELGAELAAIAQSGAIRHLARQYRRGDLSGFSLIYAATGEAEVEREIAAEANECGMPINVADAPELCSFLTPSVVRRGDLQIAISTGGACPALAARLRQELEAQFGPEYAELLEVLRAVRTRLVAREPDAAERARKLQALSASKLRECLKRRERAAAEAILAEHLGYQVTLEELGFGADRFDSRSASRANGPG
jgi:precorrin-2 dehydrogenase